MSALGELGSLRGKKALGQKKDNLAGYLFLAPWLLGLFLITIGPMVASLYLSFTDYNLIQAPKWIGLENFTRMLSDERLHNSLRVTFTCSSRSRCS
jgi:multiple sugar transport system permease protein